MKHEGLKLCFGLGALLLLSVPLESKAATYNLRADATTITLPGGEEVLMWGFADDTVAGWGNGQVTVPGPVLTVPAGQSLTIRLRNNLVSSQYACPVSLIIPGQVNAGDPVRFGPAPYPQYNGRIRSLTKETPPNNTTVVEYTWTNPRPGTYLYHSGTHMQCHMQMGLYGAVKVYAPGGKPYANVEADNEVTLLYSEIDPAYHSAVAAGHVGPGKEVSSTVRYSPKYFLINGQSFQAGEAFPQTAMPGQTTLLRLLNAGLESHAPMLQGAEMTLIAEDGKLAPYPRQSYMTLLAAGKTVDALVTWQTAGEYSFMDRRFSLADAGQGGGGMLWKFVIQSSGAIVTDDAYDVNEGATLNVPAPGVLGNDQGDGLAALINTPPSNGTVDLNSNGSFVYTPNQGWWGTDTFTYRASNSGGLSGPATVTITVHEMNYPPVGVQDNVNMHQGTSVTINVLLNDTDQDLDFLSVGTVTNPTRGTAVKNPDGTILYTPNATFTGTDRFYYTAFDGTAYSNQTTVTINITNVRPVAVNDITSTTYNQPRIINLLANDYDADGVIVPSTLVLTAPAKGGTAVINADWTVTYTPPNPTFVGTETFNYRVKDENGLFSNWAVVQVTVNNMTPVAVGDNATVVRGGSVTINVLANDYDPDGTLNPATVEITLAPSRGGTLVVNPDGTIRYTTPNATWTGVDSFRYRVKDNLGKVSPQVTVRVTVTL